MGNINLQHKFKEDEILDLNFDFLRYVNDNPSYYKVENIDENGSIVKGEEIDVNKDTPLNIYVGMLDYSKQFNSKIKLDVGAKITLSKFENDVAVRFLNVGNWQTDDDLTNIYFLDENISAVYSSLNYQINDKVSLVAGLRYEYLNSELSSETERGLVDLHYGRLFPTFYFSKKLNENNTLQFSYSRRITRPSFNQLAPFVLILTPETFVKGNEDLRPAFSDNLKVDFQRKGVILSVSYTATENSISRFQPTIDVEENIQYFSSTNIDSRKTWNSMLSFPIKLTKWWRMQNNFSWVKYNIETGYQDTNLDIENDSYRINSIHNITFSKTLTGELSGFYQSSAQWGITERLPYGRVDMGLRMKIKDNSRINLNYSDVFRTNKMRVKVDEPELNLRMNNWLYFESRRMRLTFTHNFGNSALKARKRNTASEEERRRITN